ncbi:MAG TPA: hypothetical protein DDZ22_14665, partial [Massilia sp.]|nr:hypothetical protein [Massilia sp.]
MKEMPLLLRELRAPACMDRLSEDEWDLLLRQALASNLAATLGLLAEEAGISAALPARVRRRLAWSRTVWERHLRAVAFELRQIQKALRDTGLPLILLKGAAYTAAGLPAGGGRLFSDVDILVPKERLAD